MGTATAMTDCSVLRIEKKAMMEALHREHTLSDMFVAYLLARNIRYEEDLVDQLFNSSEKRLARVLLMLAHFGKEGVPETVVPRISQGTLAEMVGTSLEPSARCGRNHMNHDLLRTQFVNLGMVIAFNNCRMPGDGAGYSDVPMPRLSELNL
jgi:hypothetical protein